MRLRHTRREFKYNLESSYPHIYFHPYIFSSPCTSSARICTSVTYLSNFLNVTLFSNLQIHISTHIPNPCISGQNSQLINLPRRPPRNLRQNKPSNSHRNKSRARKTAFISTVSHTLLLTQQNTHKNPVLTPHLARPWLIINGVQKLNIIAIRFEDASDQAAVRARRRWVGTSAA